jgi:hypothetical protein
LKKILQKWNKGNIVARNAHHKSFWQRCGHYRYAYRRYSLGNFWIFSSDLDLANINLNYMCHTCSHNSYHLCYHLLNNKWLNGPRTQFWPLYVTLTLVAGTRIVCTISLTMVIICAKLH